MYPPSGVTRRGNGVRLPDDGRSRARRAHAFGRAAPPTRRRPAKARGQVFFVPPARLPVIAHIEHGYSLREIATHLGCSLSTVHRCVHAGGDGVRRHWPRVERRRPDPDLQQTSPYVVEAARSVGWRTAAWFDDCQAVSREFTALGAKSGRATASGATCNYAWIYGHIGQLEIEGFYMH